MSKIEGSCLCGNVAYSISGDPLRMGQCHCKGCQKASGTGHMSLAFFKQEQIEINGEFSEYASTADSDNQNIRGFCANCGARMFSRNSASEGIVAVAAGSSEDNSWFAPQFIVYNKDKPGWDCMSPDVTTFEAMPPPKA